MLRQFFYIKNQSHEKKMVENFPKNYGKHDVTPIFLH